MITFSTVIPLPATANVHGVAELARQWVAGSPHTALADQLMDPGLDDVDWNVADTDEYAEAHKILGDGQAQFGLRYIKDDASGMRWITDVLYAESDGDKRAAVTVSCDSESTALTLPIAKKPYVLRQLIEGFGGGEDGQLVVSDRPHDLRGSEIEFAASLVNGVCGNSLPVVYVSATSSGNPAVDPKKLAQWLSGVAHVVVEPDREFSYRLAIEVDYRNTYGGAVGIFWPDNDKRTLLLPSEYHYDPKALSQDVTRLIRDRAIRLRIPRKLTWTNLLENRAHGEVLRLRESGSQNLEQYVANFDQEIKAKDEALALAEREIARLEAEAHGLRARTRSPSGEPLLVWGDESDLYENESLTVVVEALEAALKNVPSGSRRHHVLAALLDANPVDRVSSEYAEKVKKALSDYRSMDSATSSALEEIGFDISSDGKHHKLVFRGDERYQFSMPKTGSDHRGGRNIVSEINRTLF